MTTAVPTGLNGKPLTDVDLLIAMGCYDGIKHVNLSGSIVEAPLDTLVDMWDGSSIYTFPDGTADITHISSVADDAALRGTTVFLAGLNTSWGIVKQTVVLDASDSSTPVALTTPLMRLNSSRSYAVGPVAQVINVHNTAGTVNYAEIQIDHGRSMNAIFSIPVGWTAFLTGIAADHIPVVSKDPSSVHFHIQHRELGKGWHCVDSFGTSKYQTTYARRYAPREHLEQQTDVRITAYSNDSPCHAHASFDLVMVQNSKHLGLLQHLAEHEATT